MRTPGRNMPVQSVSAHVSAKASARASVTAVVVALGLALAGCSSGGSATPTTGGAGTASGPGAAASGTAAPGTGAAGTGAAGTATNGTGAGQDKECPTKPLTITVSVDQWGTIVSDLAGACGSVTSLIASAAVDPHDYEPSPAEGTAMAKSDLIVVNGADYDHWAQDLAASAAPSVPVLDAATVNSVDTGANPHLWYSPGYVVATAQAITAKLSELAPDAAAYFGARHEAWVHAMAPYQAAIAAIKAGAKGAAYGASEPVFEYMGVALGLDDKTPAGYASASAHESEPSPGDLKAFQDVIAGGQIGVLIYNPQTEGAISSQLRSTAEKAGVAVVSVTESMPQDAASFEEWQVGQLKELAGALGVTL